MIRKSNVCSNNKVSDLLFWIVGIASISFGIRLKANLDKTTGLDFNFNGLPLATGLQFGLAGDPFKTIVTFQNIIFFRMTGGNGLLPFSNGDQSVFNFFNTKFLLNGDLTILGEPGFNGQCSVLGV